METNSNEFDWVLDIEKPKVYNTVGKYMGMDNYTDVVLGVTLSIEKAIEKWGINIDYINKQWGSMEDYVKWLKSEQKVYSKDDCSKCYLAIAEKARDKGLVDSFYFLYIYENDIEDDI